MKEERRPTRLQDFIQAGLILILTVLLLATGSVAVGFMYKANIGENKAAIAKSESELMLKAVEHDLKLRIDRVRDVSENDSFTKDRRIRLLEEKTDLLERVLLEQKREIEKLKKNNN